MRKRPIWVWVISIFYFVSALWTLFSFYMIYSGALPLPPEQARYFASLTALDYFFTVATACLSIAAVIALFLLRKAAFYLFLAGLGLDIVLSVEQLIANDLPAALGLAGLVGAAFGWVILGAICYYTWRLKKRGVLV